MTEKISILQEIIRSLEKKSHNKRVEDLRIGLCYTAVFLSDGQLGLAYTFHSRQAPPCKNTLEAGKIKGKNTAEVIRYALSDNLLESSVGLATINALVNQQIKNAIEGDILNVISLKSTDLVGMVGFFGPLIDPIKKSAKKLYIFEEKTIVNSPDVYPSEKTAQILPECDVIIISATTLINKTIEPLLIQAKDARETIILGATTPLVPHVFTKRSVTLLSGIMVVDEKRVLRIVSEGGGMRDFKNTIKKMNIRLK